MAVLGGFILILIMVFLVWLFTLSKAKRVVARLERYINKLLNSDEKGDK